VIPIGDTPRVTDSQAEDRTERNWLDSAVKRLSADIHDTTPFEPDISIGWERDEDSSYNWTYTSRSPGRGERWGVLGHPASEADATVTLTHILVDDVIDELAEAWPRCPGHLHPAVPRLIGERAMWSCPKTGDRVSEIGHLDST
jgi:hypothetical protein